MEPAGAEDFDMLIFHTASEISTPWCALGADRVLQSATENDLGPDTAIVHLANAQFGEANALQSRYLIVGGWKGGEGDPASNPTSNPTSKMPQPNSPRSPTRRYRLTEDKCLQDVSRVIERIKGVQR